MDTPNQLRVPIEDLAALRQGDNAAWQSFFAEYDRLIASVLAWPRWGFSPDAREDVHQNIRSELPRTLPTYRGDCPLPQFIKRICVNRCIDRIRRQVRERAVMSPLTLDDPERGPRDREFPADASYDPVRRIVAAERAADLQGLLDRLDDTCLDAIRLFYESGLSYKKIAEKLSVSVNTVGSRLAKCLEKLRHLARHDPVWREESAVALKKSGE